MRTFSAFLIGLLLLLRAPALLAQVPARDSINSEETDLNIIIEDAITDIEADESTDWTIFTDYLEDLRRKPLNLNGATKDQLLLLPNINDIQATSLLEYIQDFGKLSSIYELQAVPNFDYATFQAIQPFVTVRESKEKDINPGVLHPVGPGFKTVFNEANHELLFRYITNLEEQKGFTAPDTNSNGDLSTRYLGNPYKYFFRYRMRFAQNFSVGLVAEKDQGEEFKWNPEQNFYGFDYYAGHVFLRDYGRLKRLVVGDYNLQVGQGLLLSTGLGFGKGSETVAAVKRTNFGIRPYVSVNENQFMRGAAATVAFNRIYVTPFYSRMSLDANITQLDTLTDEVGNVSTLQTSGLHRTDAEIADKDAIGETIFGGRIEYKNNRLTLGATHYFQNFGSTISPSTNDYQRFNFAGDQNYLTGVDFDFTLRNFNFFGELGRSKSGGTAATVGILAALNRKADFSLLYRDFDRNFHSNRGFAFAERPTAIRNERGVYMGLKLYPNTKWTISSYFDKFWFPWNNYQVSFPSNGHEFLGQVDFKPRRGVLLYLRYRSDHKERNARELAEGQQLEVLVPTVRQGLRLHFQYKVHRTLTVKTRIEGSWWERGTEEQSSGFLAYQDIVYQPGYKWKITGRYALFDAEDFDARIYAYENDILGFFSIPAYSGRGSRYYAILNFKPTRNIEFWLRWARSRFYNERIIGSGLNEIQGNQRTEVKVQMRLKF